MRHLWKINIMYYYVVGDIPSHSYCPLFVCVVSVFTHYWRLWYLRSFLVNYTHPGWWFGTCFIFPYIGNFIIPTDEVNFFRGVGIPPTTKSHVSIVQSWFIGHFFCFLLVRSEHFGPTSLWLFVKSMDSACLLNGFKSMSIIVSLFSLFFLSLTLW